jgi:MtN3 and saliva related transmembrane protein
MNGEWVGFIAAALTTFSFIPQAIRTIRTKETHGISLGMYVMFTVGIAFWLAYGLVLMSWPMILSNIVTLMLSGTVLALKIRYG